MILFKSISKNSAYNLKKKAFFKNLGAILLYAFLGTFISIIFTGTTMWLFSASGIFPVIIYKF